MRTSLLLLVMCLLLVGCSLRTSAYEVQNHNLRLLKGGRDSVNVVAESPGVFIDSATIFCRASWQIETPEGQTFSNYIVNALKAELSTAKLLNLKSDNKLQVSVKRVDFSSAPGEGTWYIDVLYKKDDQTFLVTTEYQDRSSYLSKKACNNIARSFQAAVAKHLRELYLRRLFRAAIGDSR